MRACNTLPHSGHGYVGPAEVKSRFVSSTLNISDPVFPPAVIAPV